MPTCQRCYPIQAAKEGSMQGDYPTMISPDRYELRSGKWGPYFHDNERGIDMPLAEVLNTLNRYALRKAQLTWFVAKHGDPTTE